MFMPRATLVVEKVMVISSKILKKFTHNKTVVVIIKVQLIKQKTKQKVF